MGCSMSQLQQAWSTWRLSRPQATPKSTQGIRSWRGAAAQPRPRPAGMRLPGAQIGRSDGRRATSDDRPGSRGRGAQRIFSVEAQKSPFVFLDSSTEPSIPAIIFVVTVVNDSHPSFSQTRKRVKINIPRNRLPPQEIKKKSEKQN